MKKEIKIPSLCTISIIGEVGCGKSIVMYKIAEMLRNEFGASVVSKDLDAENALNDYSDLDGWEKDMVSRTIWYITELKK